jgi:hypothetical protein
LLTLFHGTSSKRGSKICGNDVNPREGFRTSTYDCVFFAEDVETAKYFAIEKAGDAAATALNNGNPGMLPKNICVIEFKLSVELASELGLSDQRRRVLGEHTGMAFPDVHGGTGFERILEGIEKISAFNTAFAKGEVQHRRLRFDR